MTKRDPDPELAAMLSSSRPLLLDRIKELDGEIRAYEAGKIRRRARLRRLTFGLLGR